MLLPINTDAPIYHFPWVTISLIVTNVAIQVAKFSAQLHAGDDGSIWADEWILAFGEGLHPLQWVSWAFLHDGFWHLFGNMFFLWGFGLVVEGKLGWWRYLGLYLGIAAAAGLLDQLMMLGYDGEVRSGALGASGVIFGLMAMALVWAPKNDMTVFMLLVYQPHVFEASILAFCGWYIALQVLLFALAGFSMGSALLHLTGVVLGGAVGVLMLKKDWVDCEGWDLFAVMNNTYGKRDDYDEFRYRDAAFQAGKIATPQIEEKSAGEKVGASSLDPRVRIRKFLEAGDSISALGEYEKLVAFHPTWRLDREALAALGEAAYRDKCWEDAEPLLRQYLERFPEDDPAATARLRLKLAKTLIDGVKKPGEGLVVLREVDPATLPPKPAAAYQELRKRAEAAGRAGAKRAGSA